MRHKTDLEKIQEGSGYLPPEDGAENNEAEPTQLKDNPVPTEEPKPIE